MASFSGRWFKEGRRRIDVDSWVGRTDLEVLLIAHGTGWTFNADDVSLTSLSLGTTELVAANYTRQPLVPAAATWNSGLGYWVLTSGVVTWAALGTAEDIEALVVYEVGADDDASVPLVLGRNSTAGNVMVAADGTDLTLTLNVYL